MQNRRNNTRRDQTTNVIPVVKPPKKLVPRIYEVVVACRNEDDQRAVFERMRANGYRCRVLTL